jgi:putative solute:sodium symporter small subunit
LNQNPAPPELTDEPTDSAGLDPADDAGRRAYWKRNLRLVFVLLFSWAAVSFGCGILLHRWLDQWTVPGTAFPVGFWFAQQGSILWFIMIVFIYAWRMNKLDREFGVEEE